MIQLVSKYGVERLLVYGTTLEFLRDTFLEFFLHLVDMRLEHLDGGALDEFDEIVLVEQTVCAWYDVQLVEQQAQVTFQLILLDVALLLVGRYALEHLL